MQPIIANRFFATNVDISIYPEAAKNPEFDIPHISWAYIEHRGVWVTTIAGGVLIETFIEKSGETRIIHVVGSDADIADLTQAVLSVDRWVSKVIQTQS